MKRADGWYRLTVGDNGIGIPRGIDVRNVQTAGLRLVNIFVEQLQGTIELLPGDGTRFEIRLPLAGFMEE